jgi:hypothetical protein
MARRVVGSWRAGDNATGLVRHGLAGPAKETPLRARIFTPATEKPTAGRNCSFECLHAAGSAKQGARASSTIGASRRLDAAFLIGQSYRCQTIVVEIGSTGLNAVTSSNGLTLTIGLL